MDSTSPRLAADNTGMTRRGDNPDYVVDIDGLPSGEAKKASQGGLQGRPWLAVRWHCCQVYSRIYRNAEATHYRGRCPKCGREVQAKVGAGGTDQRFFDAR